MPGANRLYIGRSKRGSSVPGGGVALGPNLLLTPNGPYTAGNWTAGAVTETTGQTDPLSGTTASLLTDTAVNTQHFWFQGVNTVAGQKYLITGYIKPGTYTGNISFQYGTAGASHVNFDTVAHTASDPGSVLPASNITATSVANGFWKVTFNYTDNTTAGTSLTLGFNTNINAYLGTLQNVTVWGFAQQTST